MFISKKEKFIFVHIPKTAGTSIKFALEQQFVNDAEKLVLPEMRSEVYSRLMNKMAPVPPHLSLADSEKLFDIDIRKYRVVISVRNPWERLVSLFKYVTEVNTSHCLTDAAKEHGISRTIEHLVKDEENLIESFPQHAFYQAPIKDIETYFLRTEYLENDTNLLKRETGIEIGLLGHLNKSSDQSISLRPDIQHLIAYHEFPTIEKFSYSYNDI